MQTITRAHISWNETLYDLDKYGMCERLMDIRHQRSAKSYHQGENYAVLKTGAFFYWN